VRRERLTARCTGRASIASAGVSEQRVAESFRCRGSHLAPPVGAGRRLVSGNRRRLLTLVCTWHHRL